MLDSRFIRANRAALQLLGIEPDEVTTTYGSALVVQEPANLQRLQAAFKSIANGKAVHGVPLQLRRKDNGNTVWVEWSSRPVPHEDYTRTMLVDITDKVLMEQTKAALEFSLASGQVGDWDLDLIGDTSRRSLRHDQCFGYTQAIADADWGVEVFLRHIHPDDRQRVQHTMAQAIAARTDWGAEFRVVWPDGSEHWLAAKGGIYRSTENGVPSRMLGIVMDITERKRSEEALAASEQLARGQVDALTRTLDALVTEPDPDRVLKHVLSTIADQLGAHSCSVWRRGPVGTVRFHASFENGQLVTASDPGVTADGAALPLPDSWLWEEIFYRARPAVVADVRTLRDFAWRRRLLAQGVTTMLVVPMSAAGQVDAAIGIRFIEGRIFRAGEIDLAQALANQAMLSIELTRLAARGREAAVVAERNRMARDIHDTLAQGLTAVIVQLEAAADARGRGLQAETDAHLSRAEGMARESLSEARRSVRALRPRELEDKQLTDALESLIRRMTAGTGLAAEFTVQGTPAAVAGDADENLLRAVQEILTNTLRHAQATRFTAEVRYGPQEMRLTLTDNGRGFDVAHKHDGFGLLGVHERVEAAGGTVGLASAMGDGTTFAIVVPLQRAQWDNQ
jgi:PAS domain S-box-containing protein